MRRPRECLDPVGRCPNHIPYQQEGFEMVFRTTCDPDNFDPPGSCRTAVSVPSMVLSHGSAALPTISYMHPPRRNPRKTTQAVASVESAILIWLRLSELIRISYQFQLPAIQVCSRCWAAANHFIA